jgi:hypothetical protein
MLHKSRTTCLFSPHLHLSRKGREKDIYKPVT